MHCARHLNVCFLFPVNCDSDNFLNLPSVGRLHAGGEHRTVYISTWYRNDAHGTETETKIEEGSGNENTQLLNKTDWEMGISLIKACGRKWIKSCRSMGSGVRSLICRWRVDSVLIWSWHPPRTKLKLNPEKMMWEIVSLVYLWSVQVGLHLQQREAAGESICLCGARIKRAGQWFSSPDALCFWTWVAVFLNGFSAAD